ncbi:D-aminoacyl-tRNA deacylase [Leadbettera azotonutricia]|uniref:D-aminoacyl-tRNA deacylase n=1 Tax=Leadbettera azotonutricia (strain ATCC BAA-888 / DSM 13862 / ZAS-9) TaxID=545695 RepID=F5YC46_LEAAZ|nr:D-aminoacyl-tRNA deacylase [Leadbettera azotonutricia]AEF80784.1 D-tyrosyl-tRNA(Tyr) deacylase [Leadbettera azotonutricia ZAS-9]
MKAVVQRVKNASVSVEGKVSGSITEGLLVYLGVARGDAKADADWMADKVANLRIFEDNQGKMNLSVKEIIHVKVNSHDIQPRFGVLAVSQFTLLADARKGRRPYYGDAADPIEAKALYEYFMDKIMEQGLLCESGVFQAHMEVAYTNDGPVTILLEHPEGKNEQVSED